MGEYLRVKVWVDLTKPLPRGRMLHVQNRSIWIPFKYEKLLRFCFMCVVIKHGPLGCSKLGCHWPHGAEENYPYGNWLRVSNTARRGPIDEARFGRRREGGYAWRASQSPADEGEENIVGDPARPDGEGKSGCGIASALMEEPSFGDYRKSRDAVITKVMAVNSGPVSEVSAHEQSRMICLAFIMDESQYGNGKEYGAASLLSINTMERKGRGKEHISATETTGQKRKDLHARNEEVEKVKGSDPPKVANIISGAIP
jgi:hypothetical protein